MRPFMCKTKQCGINIGEYLFSFHLQSTVVISSHPVVHVNISICIGLLVGIICFKFRKTWIEMFKAFQACLLPAHTRYSVFLYLCGLYVQTELIDILFCAYAETFRWCSRYRAQKLAQLNPIWGNISRVQVWTSPRGCARKLRLISGLFSFMQGTLIFNNSVTIICFYVHYRFWLL